MDEKGGFGWQKILRVSFKDSTIRISYDNFCGLHLIPCLAIKSTRSSSLQTGFGEPCGKRISRHGILKSQIYEAIFLKGVLCPGIFRR